jgi:hypothetical protein
MSIFDELREHNARGRELAKKLEKPENYYTIPYEDMYALYTFWPNMRSNKFIEGWIAHLVGGHKMQAELLPAAYQKRDCGDIYVGETVSVGVNNVEIKSSFRDDAHNIGGKQFRFYENVPYYLIFKGWSADRYEMFLLTKAELVDEIRTRAETTDRSAFISSQGSNYVSAMTPEEKIVCLLENAQGLRQDSLTWEFSAKTETELYKRFQDLYLVSPDQVAQRLVGTTKAES